MALSWLLAGALALTPLDDEEDVRPLLQRYCVDCHGSERARARFALHDIDPDLSAGGDLERWEKVLEMVSIGDMPPPEADPQPSEAERARLVDWIRGELAVIGRDGLSLSAELPSHGNRVDHEALFSGAHTGPAYTRSRLWRISPHIYRRFAARMDMARKLTAPLQDTGAAGFRDYALLGADEATIATLWQNAERLAHTLVLGRVRPPRRGDENAVGERTGSRWREFRAFVEAQGEATAEECAPVLERAYRVLLDRPPSEDELARVSEELLLPSVGLVGREQGLIASLAALTLTPEFVFRMELGLGEELPDGRRQLAPHELAYALSYAVFDHPESGLLAAADEGRLATRADVEREFRRILAEPDRTVRGPANRRFWVVNKGAGVEQVKLMDASHPRLLRFFREYFGYVRAPEVFKDDSRHDGRHDAWRLVRDADWFVLRALKEDHQVLERLLTGTEFYVQENSNKPIRDAAAYNLDQPDPPIELSPVPMPEGQRAGLLTHPAWLVAHSGNFDTDPVRRGKWITERLLAGVVPELPIGVEAQLPDAPHQTLRERFEVVRAEECWRCHTKMNPLGEVLEAYDHFGRFREEHLVDGAGQIVPSWFEATARHRQIAWRDTHPRGHPPESFAARPVDTTGVLRGTGDPELDGPVDGPVDLMQRLAASARVRQSFLRHVFRYWMGRNETLDDSPTLIAMDRAYVASEGSFTEVLVALVTSDSFLYRR